MSKRRSNTSDAMVKFLNERVVSNQGISLQKLTGYLSQLPSDLRTKYICSVKSVKAFLQQFPIVFAIRNQSNVYLRTKSRQATSSLDGSVEGVMNSTSDRGTDGEDVTCLTDVRGTVYRIFKVYGFISVKCPIKTSVYFDVKAFENAEHTSLPASGLKVGDCVTLDAKVGPKDCEARFRASRVSRASVSNLSSPCLSLHSVNDAGGSDGHTATHLANQHGVIETVMSNYGFIKFGRNHRERAFFHANNVDKSLGRSIKNLPDVFTVADKVRFNARPSKKPSDKVKWEATTVYLCRTDDRNGAADSGDESGNEVFMSDDEDEIQDLLQAKLDEYESHEADVNGSPMGYADCDAGSAKADSCNSSVKGRRNAQRSPTEWERRQKLAGERGFFYPVTESVGTVKFGPGRGSRASAAVEVVYREKVLIGNLLWEVADGQEVSFDAVQAEDNTWVTTLVWIGQRPAKPPVGDSEDIFNRLANKNGGARKPLPNAKPGHHGDFRRQETLQNTVPESSPLHPSVSIYKDVKGIVLQVMECIATCEVEELAVSRKVEFTSDSFYKDGNVFMGDLNEALREGDTVFLDYMVGINGTREEVHCDLVWQGRRPKGVQQMSPEEFGEKLQIDTQGAENLLRFEDLETEIERAEEASRGPSRVPSDTGLQEDAVRSRGSGASSSVSVAGILTALPAASTPTYLRSAGAHNELPACESAPDVSFVSAGMNDEALLRLAKMVAAEIIAEKRLRVVLHDVGVQTVDSCPSPSARPDGVVLPPLVSSGTQTLSTGAIKSEQLFVN